MKKSKFFNFVLYLKTVKYNLYISVMGIIYLFLSIILPLLSNRDVDFNQLDANAYRGNYYIRNIINFSRRQDMYIYIVILVILTGIMVFRYLQTKKSVIFTHSLPVGRKEVYISNILAGVTVLVLPLLTLGVLLLLTRNIGTLSVIITYEAMWSFIYKVFFAQMVLYMIVVFSNMISGISVLAGVLSVLFMVLPYGLYVLFNTLFESTIYGYASNDQAERFFTNITPITCQFLNNVNYGIGFFILIIVLFFICYYLYKVRHFEKATESIVFKSIATIFKYAAAICTTVLFGLIFGAILGMENNLNLYIGYVFGTVIGYFVPEMILRKTFRVFGDYKNYFVFLICVVVGVLLLESDVFGYEKRIPKLEKIESVSNAYAYYNDKILLQDEDNIRRVLAIHQGMLKKRSKRNNLFYMDNEQGGDYIYYKLKNGKTMAREYRYMKDYHKLVADIYNSNEYKSKYCEAFKYTSKDILNIKVRNSLKNSVNEYINNKKIIDEFLEAVKKDVYLDTYTLGFNNYDDFDVRVELVLNKMTKGIIPRNEIVDFRIRSYYKNAKAVLEKYDFDDVFVEVEDIEKIEVRKMTEAGKPSVYQSKDKVVTIEGEDSILLYETSDPTKISQVKDLLEVNYKYRYIDYELIRNNIKYDLVFYMKNSSEYTRRFYKQDLPNFIQINLNK